jgi:hypothetical protein
MKLIYLKSALKSDSFDVSIGIKIPFSRVSVTIEPGRSLLTVRYHELFDKLKIAPHTCMELRVLSCSLN